MPIPWQANPPPTRHHSSPLPRRATPKTPAYPTNRRCGRDVSQNTAYLLRSTSLPNPPLVSRTTTGPGNHPKTAFRNEMPMRGFVPLRRLLPPLQEGQQRRDPDDHGKTRPKKAIHPQPRRKRAMSGIWTRAGSATQASHAHHTDTTQGQIHRSERTGQVQKPALLCEDTEKNPLFYLPRYVPRWVGGRVGACSSCEQP